MEGADVADAVPGKLVTGFAADGFVTLEEARHEEFLRHRRELDAAIDHCEAELEPLRSFIVPGGTSKAASLHVARTVCRRAERRVVSLARTEELPPVVVIFLNRVSDLLFMLARVANRRAGAGEVSW